MVILWLNILGEYFALKNSLFGTARLTKKGYLDEYKSFGYGIGVYVLEPFSLSNGSGFGKNVIIFRAVMSSLVHNDNKKRYLDYW